MKFSLKKCLQARIRLNILNVHQVYQSQRSRTLTQAPFIFQQFCDASAWGFLLRGHFWTIVRNCLLIIVTVLSGNPWCRGPLFATWRRVWDFLIGSSVRFERNQNRLAPIPGISRELSGWVSCIQLLYVVVKNTASKDILYDDRKSITIRAVCSAGYSCQKNGCITFNSKVSFIEIETPVWNCDSNIYHTFFLLRNITCGVMMYKCKICIFWRYTNFIWSVFRNLYSTISDLLFGYSRWVFGHYFLTFPNLFNEIIRIWVTRCLSCIRASQK